MELVITMIGGDGKSPVTVKSGFVGLNFVDQARDEAGCAIPLERIKQHSSSSTREPSIRVSETIARESGLFKDKCRINLPCAEGILDRFVVLVPKFVRDTNTDEIRRVEPELLFATEAFLEWWAEAGYPPTIEEEETAKETGDATA